MYELDTHSRWPVWQEDARKWRLVDQFPTMAVVPQSLRDKALIIHRGLMMMLEKASSRAGTRQEQDLAAIIWSENFGGIPWFKQAPFGQNSRLGVYSLLVLQA